MKQRLINSPCNTLNGAATEYFAVMGTEDIGGTETLYQAVCPADGVLRNLRVLLSGNPGAAKGWTFTLRINGVDSAMAVTVTNATQGSYTAGDIAVSAGDRLSFSAVPTGSPDSTFTLTTMVEFEADAEGTSILLCSSTFTSVAYCAPGGSGVANVVEARSILVAPCAGTITGMSTYLVTAPGAGKTKTFQIRVNGANAGTTISYTGAAENGSKSAAENIAIAAGDRISIYGSATAGSTASYFGLGLIFEPTTDGQFIIASAGVNTQIAAGQTRYFGLGSFGSNAFLTAEGGSLGWSDLNLLNCYTYFDAAPGAGKSVTLQPRANTGGGGYADAANPPLITVSDAAVSGNSTGTLTCADWGLYDVKVVSGAAAASARIAISLTGQVAADITSTQTLTGKARILKSATQTLPGKARIQQTVTKTLTGKARIQQTTTRTLTGKARIQLISAQTLPGKASVMNITARTLTGKASISRPTVKTLRGRARIVRPFSPAVRFKFQVPIELLTVGITADSLGYDIIEQPTYFNSSEYGGAVRCYFEVVGYTGTAYLLDGAGAVVATLGMGGTPIDPARFRVEFTPGTDGFYTVRLSANAVIYRARIIVDQDNGGACRIHIRMLDYYDNCVKAPYQMAGAYQFDNLAWLEIGAPWVYDSTKYDGDISAIRLDYSAKLYTAGLAGDPADRRFYIGIKNLTTGVISSTDGITLGNGCTLDIASVDLVDGTYRLVVKVAGSDGVVQGQLFHVDLSFFYDNFDSIEIPWLLAGQELDTTHGIFQKRQLFDPARHTAEQTAVYLQSCFDSAIGSAKGVTLIDCGGQYSGNAGAFSAQAEGYVGDGDIVTAEFPIPPVARNYVAYQSTFDWSRSFTGAIQAVRLLVRIPATPSMPVSWQHQSPIELTDIHPYSPTGTIEFEAGTQVTINTADYDGTVEYVLEVNAADMGLIGGPFTVQLIDSGPASVCDMTIKMRGLHRQAFTPNAGSDTYRIWVTGPSPGVNCRILVRQKDNGAVLVTKTRSYVPLIQSYENAESDPDKYIEWIFSDTYQSTARHTIWPKLAGMYLTPAAGNSVRFEVALKGRSLFGPTVSACLWNITNDAMVAGSEITHNTDTATYCMVEFAASAMPDGCEYELRLKGSGGAAMARVSIALDPYTYTDIWYRNWHHCDSNDRSVKGEIDQVLWDPREFGAGKSFWHEGTGQPEADALTITNDAVSLADQLTLSMELYFADDETKERFRSNVSQRIYDTFGFEAYYSTSPYSGGASSFIVLKLGNIPGGTTVTRILKGRARIGGVPGVPATCWWRGGWFGIERPRQSKMFRYGRLVADRAGFKVQCYTVDHRNSSLQHPELIGEFSADSRIPTQKKAVLLHYTILFPEADVDCAVLELTNFDKPISER